MQITIFADKQTHLLTKEILDSFANSVVEQANLCRGNKAKLRVSSFNDMKSCIEINFETVHCCKCDCHEI